MKPDILTVISSGLNIPANALKEEMNCLSRKGRRLALPPFVELLMLSRMYHETFELVTSVSWGTFLKEKGGDHLTISQRNPLKEKISEMKIAKIRLKIKRFPKVMRYLLKQYKYMMG